MITESLQRSQLLYGAEGLERLLRARVIIFGVGGVGSWCAEALVRSGIGSLTMVDFDCVDVTNINRQLPATTLTIGRPKVEVIAERLREIRPDCRIQAINAFFTAENAADFRLDTYDVIIDAIDSLPSKAALILLATQGGSPQGRRASSPPNPNESLSPTPQEPPQEQPQGRRASSPPTPNESLSPTPESDRVLNVPLFISSMGAARKLDPGQVQDAEFWKVQGCPLARALRNRFKRAGEYPARKFRCVYSPEALAGSPKGTSMPVTATFGLRLASLALRALTQG